MSWKRILYLLFVAIVAGVSALTGAVGGGLVVFRLMRQEPAASFVTAVPAVEAIPASSSDQQQTLEVNTTEVETAITKAVQDIGPAVVTVVGTILAPLYRHPLAVCHPAGSLLL